MREVRAALELRKQIILVREVEVTKGGLTLAQAVEACPDELREGLFVEEAIEWQRTGDHQIVSLLGVLRRLLPLSQREGLRVPGTPYLPTVLEHDVSNPRMVVPRDTLGSSQGRPRCATLLTSPFHTELEPFRLVCASLRLRWRI